MVKKRNVLITGADGQLGMSFKKISTEYSFFCFFFRNKYQLDITNESKLEYFILEKNINTVINCAAYTNVEMAENKNDVATLVNEHAVDILSKLCFKYNIQLIHFSTDYVFNGKKNKHYIESDKTSPLNFYGLSKLRGENKMLSYNLKNSVIIRTSWLYSEFKNNFVSKIISKSMRDEMIFVTNKEFGTPTNSTDLANNVLKLINDFKFSKTEIYHFSNSGLCSRYEFAFEINRLINSKAKIFPKNEDNACSIRPLFSPLSSKKLTSDYNVKLKTWQESLRKHINNYKNVF